jgi:hypothetical protein
MIYPRFLARLWAWLAGYFWLPCPVCKEPFAGFEYQFSWPPSGVVVDGHTYCTCPKPECIKEGQRQWLEGMQPTSPAPKS